MNIQTDSQIFDASATYSPQDDKLRLYPLRRLCADDYATVKAAGFQWAPVQECFYGIWTPAREDLMLAFVGEIDDEDKSLTERADERAERFARYRENRDRDATRAYAAASAITDGIPLGQPILMGHHSQRHAQRDAQRVAASMRKAVSQWETAGYWQSRAAGVINHAAHKERPDVRARRIKGLEADRRKAVQTIENVRAHYAQWTTLARATEKSHDPATLRRLAERICCTSRITTHVPAAHSRGQDHVTFRDALSWTDPSVTVAELCEWAAEAEAQWHSEGGQRMQRWITHYDNRLAYERALLDASGYVEPPPAPTKAVLPLLNYSGEAIIRNRFHGTREVFQTHPMSKAEFARIHADYKGTAVSWDGTHRLRSAVVSGCRYIVFLTDSKEHPRPGTTDTAEAAKIAERIAAGQKAITDADSAYRLAKAHNKTIIHGGPQPAPAPTPTPEPAALAEVRAALKAGVSVVIAPELYPTPVVLAQRMAQLAAITPTSSVLEPSAGTGRLLAAALEAGAPVTRMTAMDISGACVDHLRRAFHGVATAQADFLLIQPTMQKFDRILMNPPFCGGADIVHIRHALQFLAPGGRLVAICAGGPRQEAALRPLAEQSGGSWERLPAGAFAEAGTNVSTILLTINRAAE